MKLPTCHRYLLAFLSFYAFTYSSNAQVSVEDSLSYDRYQSNVYANFANIEIALGYCDSIINLARKRNHPEKMVDGLLCKANCGLWVGKIRTIKKHLDEAEDFMASLNEQELFWVGEKRVDVKTSLSLYYKDIGQQKRAIKILNELILQIESYKHLTKKDSSNIRHIQTILGHIHEERGDLEKALHCFGVVKKYKSNSVDLYMAGVYMDREELEKAKKIYQQFIATESVKRGGGNVGLLGSSFLNIAVIFIAESKLDSSIVHLEEALNYFGEGTAYYPTIMHKYGEALLAKEDYQKAIDYFETGLDAKRNALQFEKHPDYAQFYSGIGDVRLTQGNIKEALAQYQQAMINLVYDFDETDYLKNPELDNLDSPKYLLEVFAKKIKALYLLEQKDTSVLDFAFETSQKAIDLLDSVRLDFFAEEDKQFLLAQSYPVIEKAIAFALKMGDKEMAFQLSEKSRAVSLFESLKIKLAGVRSELDESILSREYEVKNQLMACQESLLKVKDEDQLAKLRLQKYELRSELNVLLDEMKQNPGFKKAMEKMSIASSANVRRQLLHLDKALLEFFMGEEYIYAFKVDTQSDTLQVEEIRITPELNEAILQINNTIYYERDDIAYIKYARTLYTNLLEPFFSDGFPKYLTIIPDGELQSLPFKALLTEAVDNDAINKFRDFPYLNKEVAISRLFSASSFLESQQEEITLAWEKDIVAYAPSFRAHGQLATREIDEDKRGRLDHLKYTAEEVGNIVKEFDETRRMPFIGPEATKDNFMMYGPGARVIHIATHAIVNDDYPELSFIAFTNEPDTMDHFYKLGMDEMYSIGLNAELTVLSACETGIGKVVRGEGAMSLARGFTYAGSRSVVTTLWNVEDKSTSELMELFYAHLHDGHPKDEALRLAERAYILSRDHEAAHPQYWAAITASGDMKPIFSKSYLSYILGAFGCLLLVGFYLRRRKKSA